MFSPATDVIVQSARDLHKGLTIIQQQHHQQQHSSPAHAGKKLLQFCTDIQRPTANQPTHNTHKKRGGGLYQVTSRKQRQTHNNQNLNGANCDGAPLKGNNYSGNRSTVASTTASILVGGQPQSAQHQRHQSPAAMPTIVKGKSQSKSTENLVAVGNVNAAVVVVTAKPTTATKTAVSPIVADTTDVSLSAVPSQKSANAVDVSTASTSSMTATTTATTTVACTASPTVSSNKTNKRVAAIQATPPMTSSANALCTIAGSAGNMFAIPVTCATSSAASTQSTNLAMRTVNSYTADFLHMVRSQMDGCHMITTLNANSLPAMQQQQHHNNLINCDGSQMMRSGGGGRNYSGGGNNLHFGKPNNKKSDLSHNGYNSGTININHAANDYYYPRFNNHLFNYSPQHNNHNHQNGHHFQQSFHPNNNYHHHNRNNYQNNGGKKTGWNNNGSNKSHYHQKKMSPTNVVGNGNGPANGHNGKYNGNHQNYRIRNSYYSQNPNNLVYTTVTDTNNSSSRSPTPSPKSESPTLCISSGSGGSSSNQSQHSNESVTDATHRLGLILPLDNQTGVATSNSYLQSNGGGGGGYESDSSHSSHRDYPYRHGAATLPNSSPQAFHQLSDGDFQSSQSNSLQFQEELIRGHLGYYGSHQNLSMWSGSNNNGYGQYYQSPSPLYNSNSSASSDGSFKNGDFNHHHQRRSHSGSNSPNNQGDFKSSYRGNRRSLPSSYVRHSRENLATPPDRFLARSHLVEVKETPADLLTDAKWSNLSQMIWDKFVGAQQTEDTYKKKMQLWKSLYTLIKKSNPRNGLYLVGSTISGFGSDTSDVDMCLVSRIQTSFDARIESVLTLTSLKEFLSHNTDYEHFDLIQAKVPILRFRDTANQLEVDLNFNNSVGIYNTHLLHCYAQMDWRLRPLALVVKLWAQFHHINNAKNSTISSYSLVLMVIHFLQCAVSPPVLPCLHALYPDKFQRSHDINSIDINEVLQPYVSDNKQSLGELFCQFLEYYTTFNYSQYAISVRTASVLNIEDCRLVRTYKNDPHQWKQLCIEEPFDLTNTARSVYDGEVFERIKSVFQMSFKILEHTMDLHSLFATPFLQGYAQTSSTPPS